jgi:hypothetical protein
VIVEVVFFEESFGSIALSSKKSGELKAYLYKEEKNNLLKLVGQAKEKNRKQVFFDCFFSESKYFVFIESEQMGCCVSYFG